MALDHPDGTYPGVVSKCDIKLPVDIQAQYVNLDVDVVAQTIGNLNVDIAAQTIGNLAVNIAASAITMNVTVTGTANINIIAQTVGIFLQPEWAAKEGTDKDLSGSSAADLGTAYMIITYTVPAGKTLFISHFGAHTRITSGNVIAKIWNHTTMIVKAITGGAQGCSMPLNKPIVIPGGEIAALVVEQMAADTQVVTGHIGGYEI